MLPVATTWAQQRNGIIEFNTYPWLSDVQNDNDITINVSIDLPGRFSYFSWSEFTNVLHEGDAGFALAEHNIRWGISDSLPLDLSAQWGLRNGSDNDLLRLGMRWRISDTPGLAEFFGKINLLWFTTANFKTFNLPYDSVVQLENFYYMTFPFISDRLYLRGWLDLNFNGDRPDDIPRHFLIGATQVGFRTFGNFYAILDYRINELRTSQVSNMGAGVEYQLQW